jgi:hypothetical protein
MHRSKRPRDKAKAPKPSAGAQVKEKVVTATDFLSLLNEGQLNDVVFYMSQRAIALLSRCAHRYRRYVSGPVIVRDVTIDHPVMLGAAKAVWTEHLDVFKQSK